VKIFLFRIKNAAVLFFLVSCLFACSVGSNGASETEPEKNDTDTITVWAPLWGNLSGRFENMAETELYKELERRTGVAATFINPAHGELEQFNLMIASHELPDVIEFQWNNPASSNVYGYPGGPEKAIEDRVILPLNDFLEEYSPNLFKIFTERPDWARDCMTDSKQYYCYPFIRDGQILQTFVGPIIRGDMLAELNLEIPETIGEWREMLVRFRDEINLPAPLRFVYDDISRYGAFIGAYGVTGGFYLDGGEVVYGQITPKYKLFLEEFIEWYGERLIDPNFAANMVNSQALNAMIVSGSSGAFVGAAGSGIGRYTSVVRETNPDFKLVGSLYPTLEKGEKIQFGQIDPVFNPNGSHFVITTACKNLRAAARWLDYGYGEDGHMLFNFGVEGVSYELADGYPTFTEIITNNPKYSMADAMIEFARSTYNGPFVQDPRYIEQYFNLQEQKDALARWTRVDYLHTLPPVTLNIDESRELSKIITDVNTYARDSMIEFITGIRLIEEYDAYVGEMKALGTDGAVAGYQAAYKRYAERDGISP